MLSKAPRKGPWERGEKGPLPLGGGGDCGGDIICTGQTAAMDTQPSISPFPALTTGRCGLSAAAEAEV